MGSEGAMIIVEAKDLAAKKMSEGKDHKKKHREEDEESMIEVSKVKELLENWDDKDHQYYKDVADLVGEDVEEDEIYDG
jgi:hypothetical protein